MIARCLLLATTTFALLQAQRAVPQETNDSGTAQLSALQSILTRRDLSQRISNPRAAAGFCDALFSDLAAGRNATVIEPIVETDDPKDPRLARYEACSTYDFLADDARRGGPSPQAFQGLSGTVPEDPEITLAIVGDRNFKLFSIRRDGSTDPADEILYGEWSRQRRLQGEHHGGFWLIDTRHCLVDGGAPAAEEVPEQTVRSDYLERMNLLLRYGDDYFALTLTDVAAYNRRRPEQEPLYSISVYKYDVAHDHKFEMLCAATEPLPESAR